MNKKLFSDLYTPAVPPLLKLYSLLFPLLLIGNACSYAQASGTWYQPTDVQALVTGANGTNGGTISINANFRSGSQSIAFNPASTSSKYWYNNNIGVLPGTTSVYAHILYWAKAQNSGASSIAAIRYNSSGTVGNGSSSTTTSTSANLSTTAWTRVTGYTNVNNAARYYYGVPNGQVATASDNIYYDDLVMYYSANTTTDVTKPGQPTSASLAGSSVTWTNGTDGGTNPTGSQGAIILTTTNAAATAPVLLDQGYYPANATFSTDWTIATNTTGTSYTYPAGTAQVAVVNYDKAYNYSTATLIATNTPSISITPASLPLGTIYPGVASAAPSYAINGTNLSASITVTPTANFDVSTDSATWISYPATATIPQSGGSASGNVYVRFSPSSPAANTVLSESITNASTGVTTVNASVTATVLATQPTNNGTLALNNITATTMDISLPSTGNGANRIVVVKAGGPASDPTDGTTYAANAAFGTGATTGTGSYVVYNGAGSGNVATVTGLAANTSYTFEVYEYNGSTTMTNYFTTAPATATALTVDGTLATDYFRSVATNGNWNTAATWQSAHDGIAWINATVAPDNNATSILIQPTDTVTITANTTAIALTVNSTGALIINAGKTFTIANGTGTDLMVDGYVKNAGTFTLGTGATMAVDNGAVYEDAETGISGAANANINLPTATWNTGSTFKLSGLVAAVSGDYTLLQNVRQNFYHFILDIPSFIGKLILGYNGTNALPLNVLGDFTVNATGTGNGMQFTSTGRQENVTVQGNYIQNGGTVSIVSQASSAANRSLTINQNFQLNGGTFEVLNTSNTATTNNTTTLTVKGNLTIASGAALQRSSSNGTGSLVFGGTSPQMFSNAGTVSGQLNVSVPGTAHVDFGTSSFNASTGTFTLASGGIIKTASPMGLDGTLTMSGVKTLSSACSFSFDGASAQSTGMLLPTAVNNLIINNPAGVTLSQPLTINGIDSLIAGRLVLGSNDMTISSTGSIVGGNATAYIQTNGGGKLTQATNANTVYTFPVGVNVYAPITLTPDAADNFSVQFFQSFLGTPNRAAITAPLTSVDASSYFEVSHTGSAVATLTLPYSPSASQITNTADVVVAHYNTATSSWESLSGTPGASSITVSGVSSFSPFTLGATSATAQPLPLVLKDFTAIAQEDGNLVTWVTANEENIASFELQRSADAITFYPLVVQAAKAVPASYHYWDAAPVTGTNYYRLRVNDVGSRTTYSNIVSVISGTNAGNDIHIMASPNPVNDLLYVQTASSENGTLTLMESTGRIIRAQQLNAGKSKINMQDLPAGLYLLRYEANGHSEVLKVTKQ